MGLKQVSSDSLGSNQYPYKKEKPGVVEKFFEGHSFKKRHNNTLHDRAMGITNQNLLMVTRYRQVLLLCRLKNQA
jgi:hypothetical protein